MDYYNNKGAALTVKKTKDNVQALKEMLLEGFQASDAAYEEIDSLSKEIELMKSRLEEISDKFDNFSVAL